MTSTMAPFAVESLDHIVLTVASIEKSVQWYTSHLGMKHNITSDNDIDRHALLFGPQKINLHLSGHEFEPKAARVQPGSGDLCFITHHPIEGVLASWTEAGIEVNRDPFFSTTEHGASQVERLVRLICPAKHQILEEGKIVDRTGARGRLRSVYCRDPDGNLIECVARHHPR